MTHIWILVRFISWMYIIFLLYVHMFENLLYCVTISGTFMYIHFALSDEINEQVWWCILSMKWII